MSLAILRTDSKDFDILEAELILPLIGTPTYYLTVDGDEAPGGAVGISFSTGVTFAGVVARAVAFEGRVHVVVVGGGGGLSGEPEVRAELEGAGYTGTPLVASATLLVGDILTASNERLSDDAAELVDLLSLPRWQRVAGLARHALGALALALAVSWRVRPDGLVWLGEETFEAYDDEPNVLIQRDDTDASELHCALEVDRPDIQPGMALGDRRIVGVVYTLAGDALRARLRYESSAGGMTLSASLEAALGPTAGIYAGAHPSRVVKVNADDSVDLLPANEAIGARTGIAEVPFRTGLYAARQILAEGADVILRFGSSARFPCGDPSLPYCEAAAQDPTADRGIARNGDKVQIGTLLVVASVSPTIPPNPLLTISFAPAGSPFGVPGTPVVVVLYGTILSGIDMGVPYALEAWIATGSREISLRRLSTEGIP
jgi:hypothetical protein